MRRPLRPTSLVPRDVPDLERFAIDVVDRVNAGVWALTAVEGGGPIFVARAPGRLDVMGGIADYSGALVLQWPIHEATRVAVRPWAARNISITSIGHGGVERRCDVPLDVVGDPHRPYDSVHAWFSADANCSATGGGALGPVDGSRIGRSGVYV